VRVGGLLTLQMLISHLSGSVKLTPRSAIPRQTSVVEIGGTLTSKVVNVGSSDVTVTCGHNTISMLWGNTAYCVKLRGEDLSRYSNKIESAGLRRCPYYHILTKKVMSQ